MSSTDVRVPGGRYLRGTLREGWLFVRYAPREPVWPTVETGGCVARSFTIVEFRPVQAVGWAAGYAIVKVRLCG